MFKPKERRSVTRMRIKLFRDFCSVVGFIVISYGIYLGGDYIVHHYLLDIGLAIAALVTAILLVVGAVQVFKDIYKWLRQRKTRRQHERLLPYQNHKHM